MDADRHRCTARHDGGRRRGRDGVVETDPRYMAGRVVVGDPVRRGSRNRGGRVERKPVVIAPRHLVVHRSTAATRSSVIPEAAPIASWRAVTSTPATSGLTDERPSVDEHLGRSTRSLISVKQLRLRPWQERPASNGLGRRLLGSAACDDCRVERAAGQGPTTMDPAVTVVPTATP